MAGAALGLEGIYTIMALLEKMSGPYLMELESGGGILGVWMITDELVFLTPVAVAAGIGLGVGKCIQKRQISKLKPLLLLEAQEVISALKRRMDAIESKEVVRITQIETIIILLERIIKELHEDIKCDK